MPARLASEIAMYVQITVLEYQEWKNVSDFVWTVSIYALPVPQYFHGNLNL